MEQAQALYDRMHKECINYDQTSPGMLTPRLNFTALIGLVHEEFDSSQVLIQLLGQPSAEDSVEVRAQRRQHGTWLLMAYIVCFGKNPENVRFLRMVVPELYEAAVNGLTKLAQ
jgi:hypothetical protein